MKLLKVPALIPAHYATFPVLTGTPAALREALSEFGLGSVEVVEMKPGETAR
jgi:L-ascorbate metabolism protein UlaG (beta-lactamase superfamily)